MFKTFLKSHKPDFGLVQINQLKQTLEEKGARTNKQTHKKSPTKMHKAKKEIEKKKKSHEKISTHNENHIFMAIVLLLMCFCSLPIYRYCYFAL